jgi:hypothetical protein
MLKKWIRITFGTFFLAALIWTVAGTGCGGEESLCGPGEQEVCGALQQFEKNGVIQGCVCIPAPCSSDFECDFEFFCDEGFCAPL